MRALVSRLLGLSRAGPPPEWLPCLAGLLDAVRAADQGGPVAFADCAFPRHALFHVEPAADLLRLPEADTPREEFHATFNAAGGSKPVPVCTAETVERLAAGRSLWLYADGFSRMRPLLPVLARVGAGIVCPQSAREADLPPEWTEIRPVLPDGTASGFALFLPRTAAAATRLAGGRPSKRGAGGVLSGSSKPGADDLVTLPIVPRDTAGSLMIDANRLVTDNGYIAEQAELWSWLWTGPAQMSRFALGRVPSRAARVEVHFIPSDLHRSLGDNLVLQLDGRIVPHHGEFLRDGSGRAWIDLADASFTILTVACRTVQDHGGRRLRACVSRIGFAP